MTEEQLSALLRLKRYEQPPAEYYDQLLRDIHRRQRSELLHRPLWQIAVERLQTFFGEHSMSRVGYAGSMAAAMLIGVALIGLLISPGNIEHSDDLLVEAAPSLRSAAPEKFLSILASSPAPRLDSPTIATVPPGTAPVAHQPRYIIDARPASYEPSSSFKF